MLNEIMSVDITTDAILSSADMPEYVIELGETYNGELTKLSNEGENEKNELGKFKTTAALLKAYSNLEKEFTRRSQLIKELERQLGNTRQLNTSEIDSDSSLATTIKHETVLGKTASIEDLNPIENSKKSGDVEDCPDNLLMKNLDCMTRNKVDIAITTASDSDIVTRNIAKSNSELIADLLEDSDIKNQLFKKLLDEVSNISLPKCASSRGQSILTPQRRPRDIAEAGRIAAELMKSRRI